MMAPSRRAACDRAYGRQRLARALAFLEVASRETGEQETATASHTRQVAVANAVQAAIAAADAICCALLGAHSRDQDHREAVRMLAEAGLGDGGPSEGQRRSRELSKRLAEVLELKSRAEYGIDTIGSTQYLRALRNARQLVEAATAVLGTDGRR